MGLCMVYRSVVYGFMCVVYGFVCGVWVYVCGVCGVWACVWRVSGPIVLCLIPLRHSLPLNIQLVLFQLGWQPTNSRYPLFSIHPGTGVKGALAMKVLRTNSGPRGFSASALNNQAVSPNPDSRY